VVRMPVGYSEGYGTTLEMQRLQQEEAVRQSAIGIAKKRRQAQLGRALTVDLLAAVGGVAGYFYHRAPGNLAAYRAANSSSAVASTRR